MKKDILEEDKYWDILHPIYDISKSYEENLKLGPSFPFPYPERKNNDKSNWKNFLGYKIASPIGVPAGPLLDGKWVLCAAKLGFDVLTYKTIRSCYYPAHPWPNIICVDPQGLKDKQGELSVLETKVTRSLCKKDLSITNSFGVPSQEPEFFIKDIANVLKELNEGQLLIVSIMNTLKENTDPIKDFVDVACMAKEAGSPVIELNFSCPNLCNSKKEAYKDSQFIEIVLKKVKEAVKDIPLIAKLGVFSNDDQFQEVLQAVAKGGGQAVCGINTIKAFIKNGKGEPALGKNREKAGICGYPLLDEAIKFTKKAKMFIEREKLGLKILTTGGALESSDLEVFLSSGADVAMTATGMMWDPFIAYKYHNKEGKRNE